MNIFRLVLYYIKYPFFLGHIVCYLISNNKSKIDKDVFINNKWRRCNSFKGINALVFLLQEDVFFRTLFYVRIGRLSYLISWLFKGDNTFHPNDRIGGGILLFHPYSTVLNAKSVGDNLVIHQCTTIGNKSNLKEDECPIIGANVQIGANACIIGSITIGDNSIIGAGSVVVKDVPANAIVAGNPAKIIRFI